MTRPSPGSLWGWARRATCAPRPIAHSASRSIVRWSPRRSKHPRVRQIDKLGGRAGKWVTIPTGSQLRLRPRDFPQAGEKAAVSTGRLVMLWYAGLLAAALLVHWALRNAESVPLSAALLAGA